MGKESRRFPRIEFSGPLRCSVRGSPEVTGTVTQNLSLSGIGFISSSFLAPSTTVMLQIQLLSRIIQPIAQIVWSSPVSRQDKYRHGARFIECDPQDKKNLSDFLTMRSYQQL